MTNLPGARVPGAKHYRASSAGLREIGVSDGLRREALAAAAKVAAEARLQGKDDYRADTTIVRAGRQNEPRVAGRVSEATGSEPEDRKNRVLQQALRGQSRAR